MADTKPAADADDEDVETLELDEILEKITFYCIQEAQERLEEDGEVVPFTVVVQGEDMYVETHPAETPEDQRASAVNTIRTMTGNSSHYAFCYDGFLETDDGDLDALIVECASRDMDTAHAIAYIYKPTDDGVEFDDAPVYVDETGLMFAPDTDAEEEPPDELEDLLGLNGEEQ
ncbi:MAG: hypothetical protein LUD25_01790 [Coriobacteriaceae bacterium]|nr:hypothetical protein [Coriobacteriaceae bacterium]